MKVRQFIVQNKEIIVRSVFVFLVLAITVFGLTFAWYSFTNPDIDVAGNTSSWCDGLDVTASGGTITNANLGSPKAAYNSNGATANTTFSITNNENSTVVVDISITNITMDSALKNEYFMYTLTEGNTVISEGNFNSVSSVSGGFIVIKQNLSLPASTTKNYSLYLWIKNNGGNQNDMQNKTFSGNMKMNFSSSFCNASNNNISLDSLYYNITKGAVLDNTSSTYVTSSTGIDFTQISSDTNGKGIYIRAGTENDYNPIYYYRGAVDNNNILFANFCWKIVRTTDTGGIKLIYNGTPTDGKCSNTTGDNTQLSTTSNFNANNNSPAYVGYMYGTRYTYTSKSMSSNTNSYVYGNSVTYNNGTYTLTNTISGTYSSLYNGGLNNNHYTCFTTSNTCTNVYYIYYTSSSYAYYITLSNGKKVEDALSEMFDTNPNQTSSTIKTNIDDWYSNNMTSYTDNYIEDTIYCNDRSIYQLNGWNPNGGSTTAYLYFGAYGRSSNPIVTCPRDIDKFTVSSGIGNGKLSYPVGLLTEDEVRLAGGSSSSNSSYYLYTNKYYWLASPYNFRSSFAYEFYVFSTGYLFSNYHVNNTYGVRPVVSLKPNVRLDSGDGTANNPYTVSAPSSGGLQFVNRQNANSISVGDELAIDTEHFYVITSNSTTTSLLAKYNLNVGDNKVTTDSEGIQSINATGWVPSATSPYPGSVSFSNTSYWLDNNSNLLGNYGTSYPAYVYDSSSNLYQYIESYKNTLMSMGINNISGRLMTYEEAVSLGCSKNETSCSSAPSEVYSSSYWLGSVEDNLGYVFIILSDGLFHTNSYDDSFHYMGVRPVIDIPTSYLTS